MALISGSLAAARSVGSRVNMGLAVALRAVGAVADVTSVTSGYRSNQRCRVFSGPQAEALAAAIEVEILSDSWRARHRPPEDEIRRHPCLCARGR
jgi:hypothetical protein